MIVIWSPTVEKSHQHHHSSVKSPEIFKKINIRRNSILKKLAGNQYPGGFWGEKSRGANGFWIWPHLTLTGPLVKIGGLSDIFESYLYRYENMFYRFCNFSVTPFQQKIFSKLFSGIRVVGKGSWKKRSWTVLNWKVPSWKFLFEFERAQRNWRDLSEVGKNWVKLEKFFRSLKISLKLESFVAVGNFWQKLESLNELGKLSRKLKSVTAQRHRKSGQVCLVLVHPDRQTTDSVFSKIPDRIRTDKMRTERHRAVFFLQKSRHILLH